jgi:site-specific DNA recombinase
VWTRVEEVLTQPEIIEAEVARIAKTDPFTADLAAIDDRLEAISNQRMRLARAIGALDDVDASAPLLLELKELARQADSLKLERLALEFQTSRRAIDRERLADIASWCRRVSGKLPTLTYEQKRMVLEALGVGVKVFSTDHDPRWEIAMAPIPVDTPSDEPFVFNKRTRSTTATPRSTRNRSTASRSC